ncbi:GntR family transcriptional regulator [Caulobacter sp. 1776]|uniref:FadR/GntR family transcriptional regulator n=1 Tax=Caulobacter sp. 1776 TaxID=3156420 RepID=UPI003392F927
MPSFASLRPAQVNPLGQRAPHRLAYELLTRIKGGVFRQGDWLPTEQALLAEFPVSRTVLREAMIVLECLGLIESHHGVGSRVIGGRPRSDANAPSAFDLTTLLEACQSFEVEAAGLAASLDEEGAPSTPLAGLSLSGPLTVETCRLFHVSLAQATGNAAIQASIEHLWNLAAARPALRDPFNGALARAGRAMRTLQANVVQALARRSPVATREAVRALFDGYLAAALEFEHEDRLTRLHLEGAERRRRWNRRTADRSRLDEA